MCCLNSFTVKLTMIIITRHNLFLQETSIDVNESNDKINYSQFLAMDGLMSREHREVRSDVLRRESLVVLACDRKKDSRYDSKDGIGWFTFAMAARQCVLVDSS